MSKRTSKMDVSGIRRVFELAKKMNNPIDLSIGKPDFAIPENIKKVANKTIDENKNDYTLTVGIPELRQAVAEKLETKNKIKTKIEEVIITSAVSGGLSVVLPTLIDEGDEVIIFDPYFVGYKQLIILFGGIPVVVSKDDDFLVNIEGLKKAITSRTKAIILNTPENPTGHVWSRVELEAVATIANENNLTIISDEIYEDFVYGTNREHISVGSFYDKTVTLGGFSKSQAMTGWRVGYLRAPSDLIKEIIKVQQFTFVCAPTPFQYAGLEALKTDMTMLIDDYRQRRDFVFENLRDKFDIIQSQGAFYFFIKYPYEGKQFVADCFKNNLLIVPGSSFSEKDTHFRISFASGWDNIKQGVEILKQLAKR